MRRLAIRILLAVLIGGSWLAGAAWQALAGDELDEESEHIRIAIAISQSVNSSAEGLPKVPEGPLKSFDFRDAITANPFPPLEVVKDHGKIVRRRQMLFFTASWCTFCRPVKLKELPRLQAVGYEVSETGHIREVDVDQNPDLMTAHRVTDIPAFVVLLDGREINRHVGALNANQISELYNRKPIRAAVKAAAAVPRSIAGTLRHYSARWSFPGSIQAHLSKDHGIDTRGMSEADMKAAHDRIHDQIGPVRAHAGIRGRRQSCPGGKCP